MNNETRQGKTGKWTLSMVTADGKIAATSEWGTVYLFDRQYWEILPLVTEPT